MKFDNIMMTDSTITTVTGATTLADPGGEKKGHMCPPPLANRFDPKCLVGICKWLCTPPPPPPPLAESDGYYFLLVSLFN